ncbi:MAG: DNA-binding response regulator [SAR86 cluster bacterium]|uniref:DNA-binding response regulator n=1 Tax=SAR86 cluster bacterium TaxID=2030880 RepID=A0A2A5AU93_9GAMM|nr:MAG: DNA-binding response regulator [SAR86 cluster bacterium]
MQDDLEKRITVLLADDHELVREGIARLLADQTDIHVVAQVSSGEDVLEYMSKHSTSASESPDIILMDARMPGLGGIETTREVVKQYPNSKVVAISSVSSGVIPSQILRSGAMAFITKSVSVEEMLKAIRVVNAGEHYVTPSVAKQLCADPFTDHDSLFDKLSRRELQIAQMLTDGKKVSQVATYLGLSPKTVYSYRYRIFEKLGIRSDVELTILAVKHGLSDDTREFDDVPNLRLIVG